MTNAPDPRADAIDRLRSTLAWIAALVVAGLLARALADVLILVFAAVLIATVLRGAAERLGRLVGLGAGAALTMILLGGLAAIALAVWLRGPALVREGMRLGGEIAGQIHAVRGELDRVPWGNEVVTRARAYLDSVSGHVAGMISGFATGTLGAIGSVAVLVVAALYFAIAPGLYVRGTLSLLPPSRRDRGAEVLHALAFTLRRWFVGQLVDMLVIGVLTGIGLWQLGVPLSGTLAAIAALFNFVPYIGALAGAVPAVLIALGQGPTQALWVGALFLVVQTLEGNVVAPLIQRRTVQLPPVLTIFSQTVLGTLFGPFGLILATPITAAAMVLVRMLYVEDVLGDHDSISGSDPVA